MSQDITDKIAKLLALAESTSNPHEAEAFTEKAETLMLQYGIEQAHIEARRPGTQVDPIVVQRIRVSGPYREALVSLGWAVSDPFNLKSYKTKISNTEIDIWLVGHTSDAERASILVRSLLLQSEQALKFWWKTEGKANNPPVNTMNQYRAKRQFLFGFVNGVHERLGEIFTRVVAESTKGTDLVLFDRSKKVEDWVENNLTIGDKKNRGLKGGSFGAALAGTRAGRAAVGNRQIT